jgi:CARDB
VARRTVLACSAALVLLLGAISAPTWSIHGVSAAKPPTRTPMATKIPKRTATPTVTPISTSTLTPTPTAAVTDTPTAATLPDLIVQSITLGSSFGTTNFDYTVTVQNLGAAVDVANVVLQGYYSSTASIDPLSHGACGTTIAPNGSLTLTQGSTTDVFVGCSGGPGTGDNFLVVDLDISNVVTESNEGNNLGSVSLPASAPTPTDTAIPTPTNTQVSGGSIVLHKNVCLTSTAGLCNFDTSQSGQTATFTVYNSDSSGTQGTQCGSVTVATIVGSSAQVQTDCVTLVDQHYLICETSNTFSPGYTIEPRPGSTSNGTQTQVGSCILLTPLFNFVQNTITFRNIHP